MLNNKTKGLKLQRHLHSKKYTSNSVLRGRIKGRNKRGKLKNSKKKVNDVSPSSSKMSSNKDISPTPPLPIVYTKPSRKVTRSLNTASNTNILRVYTCSLREGIAIVFVTKPVI